jgi:glucans biosynthesis protein
MRRSLRIAALERILLSSLLVACAAQTAGALGLEDVARRAKQLAASAYADPRGSVPQWLLDLNYDQYRDIRFRPERALWGDRKLPFSVQFFHPGFFYDRAVSIHVVSSFGAVSPVSFSPDQFDYGRNEFESRVPQDLGYAGFRIHYPIKSTSYHDEVAAFLGASYFRAVGRDQVYGLSARGVAIDTALSSGEEFPWFREFWLVQPAPGAQELTLFALLDSPSATGAYRFVVAPGPQTHVDVEMRLFPRRTLGKLGIAPLTSMFLHGESAAGNVADYRPEVHDSDGLLVSASSGEWLWRPLENPQDLSVTSFELVNPRGFGLVQRDRAFDHYQDIEARPDLRPSAWVQPKGDWGAGRVELVEIPTRNDTNNNVVAYWVPQMAASTNTPISYAYSVFWYGDDRVRPPGGRSVATRQDGGTHPKARRLVVDFEGEALRRLPADAVVEGRVSMIPSRGASAGLPQTAELLEQQVIRNPATGGWRLVLQVNSPDDPVELRAFLRHGADAVSETWSYLLVP